MAAKSASSARTKGSPIRAGTRPLGLATASGIAPASLSQYRFCVKLPIVNQPVNFVIKGKAHRATCIDVFDGGYGYYFDAVFPKTTRYKFSAGEQCGIPELGPKCLADFVSYPKQDAWTVRFLLPKWS
jgi:hypothetical protein